MNRRNALGKEIPAERRQRAYNWLRNEINLDQQDTYSVVSYISDSLERDQPYGAINEARKYLDLTGSYRLLAILLTDE